MVDFWGAKILGILGIVVDKDSRSDSQRCKIRLFIASRKCEGIVFFEQEFTLRQYSQVDSFFYRLMAAFDF